MDQCSQLIDSLPQPLLGPKLAKYSQNFSCHQEAVAIPTVVAGAFERGADAVESVTKGRLKNQIERSRAK
jgi:hypothetical protein